MHDVELDLWNVSVMRGRTRTFVRTGWVSVVGETRTNFKGCNANEGEADTIDSILKSFIDVVSTVHVVYHNMKWGYDHQCKQIRVWEALIRFLNRSSTLFQLYMLYIII